MTDLFKKVVPMPFIVVNGNGWLANAPLFIKVGFVILCVSPFIALWIYWRNH